jgi:GDP-fucose transporter C1
LTIVAVVAFYWIVSIALVFQNKNVLSHYDFSYPLLVTLFQLIFTSVCLILLGTVGQRSDKRSATQALTVYCI